jgi:uncharacterized membrane protein
VADVSGRIRRRAKEAPLETAHVLALSSALLSAVATILIRQGLRGSDPFVALWLNLVVGVVTLWVAVPLTEGFRSVSGAGIALFVMAGLVGTVAGRLLRFVSIERVGPSIAAALNNLHPLFAAAFAIVLLGERVTAPIMLGTIVIVVGTTVLSIGRQRLGFRRAWLFLPVLSAACFGFVAILRKLGLAHVGPVLGTAINVTTAFLAFTAFLVAWGRGRAFRSRGRTLGYFVAAGLAENASVFINIVALGAGMVSVVTPLYGTAPIFVLVLSFVFLRGVEVLNARIVGGTVLIVLGVYLITALA